MTAARPAATVVTGDLTMRAGRGQFQAALALIEQLPRPRLVVIGNHDIPLHNPLVRVASPYRRYRRVFNEDLDPALDCCGVRIQGLMSMPPWRWKSGRVTRRQCRHLVEVLSDAAPGTVRVVALHHPPGQRWLARLAGRRHLLAALADAQVELVLAGHTHVPATRRTVLPGGAPGHPVVEVVAGTATSTRTRGTPRSWTLIHVDTESLSVEHRFLDDLGSWRSGETTHHPRRMRT